MTCRMRRWTGLAMLMAAVLAAPAAAQAPDNTVEVLNMAPADAWVVVGIKNLKTLNDKVSGFCEALQLPPVQVLAMAKQQLGLNVGIDDTGAAVMAVLDMNKYPDKPFAMILPVNDIEAMTAALNPSDAGDAVTKVDLGGQPSFLARKGARHYVLAPSKEIAQAVAAAPGGLAAKMTPKALAAFAAADVFAHIDMVKFGPKAKEGLQQMPTPAPAVPGGPNPQQMLGLAAAAIDQLEAVDVAASVGQAGVKLGFLVTFKDGSELATAMADAAPTDASLLRGLPAEKYLVAAGGAPSKAGQGSDLLMKWLDMSMGMLAANGQVDAQKLANLKQTAQKFMAMMKGMSLSISVLPEGADGMVGVTEVLDVTDSAEMMKLMGPYVDQVKAMSGAEGPMAAMMGALTYTPAAEQIDGVSVDHFVMDFEKMMAAAGPQGAPPPEMMTKIKQILGTEGLLVRVAAAGPSRVAVSMGGGRERMARVLQLAKAGQAPLGDDAGIKKVAARLPAARTGEFYLAADNIMLLIKRIMTAMGQGEMMPQVPEVNAPLAVTINSTGRTGEMYLFAPTEMIVAVKNMAMQFMMMRMMGGPEGPGAPAPVPPQPGGF